MSTREEVVAALTACPNGLTSKELAPMCPACECDELVVGRTIAGLRSNDEIHESSERRDGATVWILGKRPQEDVGGPITLPYAPKPDAPHLSVAAREIAAMRASKQPAQPKTAAGQASAGTVPLAHERPAAPAPAAAPLEEQSMSDKKPLADRIHDALKAHGPMDAEQLAKRSGTTRATIYTMAGTLQKKFGVTKHQPGGKATNAIYALPGQKTPEPKAKPFGTSAHGSPFAKTVADLEARRAGLMAEVSKIDRAIEAVRAVA